MPQRATWKKAEKLKSRKRIERVFREGKSFSVFPYKVVFLVSPAGGGRGGQAAREVEDGLAADGRAARKAGDDLAADGKAEGSSGASGQGGESSGPGKPARSQIAAVQAGFGAASRNFKKAVDRNRIKRLSREAYRLQKGQLLAQLARKELSMAVFFVFIGKELPDYQTVSAKIGVALQKLMRETE